MLRKFSGKTTTVAEIEEFVVVETAFRETHYKRQVLKVLEDEGKIKAVDPAPGRKSGTFGDPRMKVSFIS
jgi:hypothetical protein